MQWRSTLRLCLILAALGLAAAFLQRLPGHDVAGAATAIDGDSLRLADREIRLKGIDAPEYRQTCQGERGEVACGQDARRALAALLARGSVRCRIAGRDRFRRDLGYCRTDETDINAAMVRDGRALAFGDYEAEEREARAARRGLWALKFDPPSEWRDKHPRFRPGS